MRDILVFVIFFAFLFMAFRRPYVAALLWVWIGLMNPHRLGWGAAYDFPFAMIAAVALVLSIAAHPGSVRLPSRAPAIFLLLLVVWMGVTTLAAIEFHQSLVTYVQTLKVLLMVLVVASVVTTREEILGLVTVSVGSVAFFGVKGGIFTILTGGSHLVWGPPSSVIEGNNELAVALIVTVPMLYYLTSQVASIRQLPFLGRFPEKLIRVGLFAAILLSLISALGSHSRGALLSMGGMGMVLWWRSKSKMNVAMVIAVMSLVALYFMPEGWIDRMSTIGTYGEDSSAMGRINAWTMAINIANDRILGAGFETALPAIYLRYAPNPNFVIVAHSIYFQVLGQHGYVGLFLYLLFWLLTYSLAGRVTKLTAGRDDLQWAHLLASMSKVSMVGFAVGGAFLSLAYWDFPFYFMVILVCTERLVRDVLEQERQTKSDADLVRPPVAAKGPFDNRGKHAISTSGSRS